MKPRARAGRGSTASFVAYERLNEAVRVALRNLGKRIKRQLKEE